MTKAQDEIVAIAQAMPELLATKTQINVQLFMDAQRKLGERPRAEEAMQLCTVHELLAWSGGDISALTQLGMSRATAYRRRARLAQLIEVCDFESAAEQVVGLDNLVLARELFDRLEVEGVG